MGRAGDGGLCLVCRAEDHREAEAAETRTEGPRR